MKDGWRVGQEDGFGAIVTPVWTVFGDFIIARGDMRAFA